MPFDFAADFADVASEFADVAFEATDVASEILDSGAEFLNEFGDFADFDFASFESGLDLSGGIDTFNYAEVGSFAGDASWWDANNFGDIFGGPEPLGDLGGAGFTSPFDKVSDFFGDLKDSVIGPEQLAGPGAGSSFFGSLVDRASSVLPSTDQLAAQIQKSVTQQIVSTGIKAAAGAISGATAGIPVVGGIVSGAVNRTAGAVNASINQQIGRGTNLGNISLAQLTGITPNIGIPNVPGIQVASLGPVPLNNILVKPTPAFANGQPLPIQTPGVNPTATQATVFDNYQSSFDAETGAYAVIGQDGLPLSGYSNLTEEQANQIAQEANANARDAGSLQPTVQQVNPSVTQAVNQETGDYYVPAPDTAPGVSQIERSAGPVGYTTAYDVESNTYSVVNLATGLPVTTGLTEQQAQLQAQEQGFYDEGIPVQPGDALAGPPLALAGNLTPEQLNQIAAAQGVDAGDVAAGGVTDQQLFNAEAATTAALRDQARQQQTIRDQRQNKAQAGDWRVRLRLAPNSNYLYNDPDCGPVLWPLQVTDGVIFPYTPAIDLAYKANYSAYDLTHSNYKGYFYQNSAVDLINVRATFTAQDTQEANYLLAVIHFFRSATKMFYGQDAQRGSPPPLCYLSGYGDYQFSEHPVVISQFNYNLPADVNYIRSQTATNVGVNLAPTTRNRQSIAGNPLSYALQRLKTLGQGINKGALDFTFATSGSLGVGNPTYVPTKIEITLALLPMQSRQQVSKQFSLKGFANGNLLKGGFW